MQVHGKANEEVRAESDSGVAERGGNTGTAGLGAESVLQLAKHHPAHIYFSGRNSKSAEGIIKQIKTAAPNVQATFLECDLASLSSVKVAAESFLASSPARLDILMCNAGVMAKPPNKTKDGYELQFGTNHVGHALLIKKLLPTLLQTVKTPDADVRVIILTSVGFRGHPKGGISFKDLKTEQSFGAFGSWIRYGQSKLANILYARELARRYPSITTLSIHPGTVQTHLVGGLSLSNKLFVYVANGGQLLKPAEGAYNQLWATCVAKSKVENGQMYEPVGLLTKKLDSAAKDDKLAEKLWEWTEKELEGY